MTVGRYMLFKKIARGGMAEIYLGKQIGEDGFQRICCIKRILPHYAQDKEFIEMFRDEAHICKRLQHANIVRVEGFEEVEGSYAIIMEFIDGADLRSVLSACEKKQLRLAVPMAVYIIAEAARGLHYAHTKIDEISNKPLEIVHRDISPQNILVSFEGEVKVTDFGIADAESKATETKPGIVKGKYSYMSPEQISAKPVDARTDVFALAIVLWEMLAMKRLFQGENEVMTIQLVKNCKISKDLSALNPQVDEELHAIILKGLKKDVRERYASAAAFEKDLRRYLSKQYADFTTEDLGSFLKTLLDQRRQESIDNIKQLLSEQPKTDGNFSSQLSLASDGGAARTQTPIQPLKVASIAAPIPFDNANPSQQPSMGHGFGHTTNGSLGQNKNRTMINQASSSYGRSNQNTSSFSRVHQKRTQSNSLTYVLVLLGIIFMLAAGYFAMRKIAISKLPATLEIRTTPSIVKVKLDGKPIENHTYIKTPLVIKRIVKGDHTISFIREGFAEETIQIYIKPGETIKRDDIVLKQIKDMAPVRVSFESKQEAEVRINIDDGIVNETVKNSAVLNLEYITFGEPHSLAIFPTKEDFQPFKCRFVPRAQNWRAPYLIVVSLDEGYCKFPPR